MEVKSLKAGRLFFSAQPDIPQPSLRSLALIKMEDSLLDRSINRSSSSSPRFPLFLSLASLVVAVVALGLAATANRSSGSSSSAQANAAAVTSVPIHMVPYDYGMYPYGPDSSLTSPFPNGIFLNLLASVDGPFVSFQFPQFNFYTYDKPSPLNKYNYEQSNSVNPPEIPGGFFASSFTGSSGLLPENLRPLKDISFVAASNDGLLNVPLPRNNQTGGFSFQVTITSHGQIIIGAAGTFNNVLPPGAHTFLAQTVKFSIKTEASNPPSIDNFIVQSAFTNYSGLLNSPNPGAPHVLNDAYRDSHVNDYFDGLAAFSWTSNSERENKSDGAIDLYISLGEVGSDGISIDWRIVRLTNLPAFVGAWDTAIAINRANSSVILVSFGLIHYDKQADNVPNYFLSNDRGKSFNGPYPVDPTIYKDGITFGDCRGVTPDPFGNFWYSVTIIDPSAGTDNNAVWVSSDFGASFSLAYRSFDSSVSNQYDYPQISFGFDRNSQDPQARQGLWLSGDYYLGDEYAMIERIIFVPTLGLGKFTAPEVVLLPNLLNQIEYPVLATSQQGHLFMLSSTVDYINWQPNRLTIKSPPAAGQSPLDSSLFNPELSIMNVYQNYFPSLSYSDRDFFSVSVQDMEFDDSRQLLLVILNERPNIFSQDYHLFLLASKDFGATWSPRIPIASSNKGNRGFSSMARDPASGGIIIQFYDGRNDPNYQSQQLMGAFINPSLLEEINQYAMQYS